MAGRSKIVVAALGAFLILAGTSRAEADEANPSKGMAADDVVITGSAASFDNRLPPVIPGEEIQHNGRRTKVWSTSGPVPVGSVPPAPPAPGSGYQANGLPNTMGVIVDNRPQPQNSGNGRK